MLSVPLANVPVSASEKSAPAQAAPVPAIFSAPPVNSGTPFGATALDLKAKGYVEQEFLVRGTANRYRMNDPLKTAEVIDSGHAYTSRILVRRPVNPRKFNGIVVVEWFNVTGMQDLDFSFGAMREHLLASGYAWVGVSAQHAGINALKTVNPARYGTLKIDASNEDPIGGGKLDERAGDVLAWDIYAQIGQSLRTRAAADPLGGLQPKLVIAMGESQSALKLTSYYNAIHPRYPAAYDGFHLYDRFIGGLRSDIATKVFSMGSEVVREGFGPAPADAHNFRLWEPAGAAHLGLDEMHGYMDAQIKRNGVMRNADGSAGTLSQSFVGCGTYPLWSRVPNGHVLNAGLEALVTWIKTGKAPPSAPRLVGEEKKLTRDAEGRVSGGVRLAAYDAPMAKNMGANTGPGFCGLPGSHQDFTPAEMCSRYGSPKGYVARVTAVTRRALRDGYLLKADAEWTIREAKKVRFSCGG